MSVISMFFKSEASQLLLSAVALLITFYAIGRVVQSRVRFNKSNTFISIPIGMFTFLLLNQIVYTPAILLSSVTGDTMIITIIDYLKAFSLILLMAITYKEWMPTFSMIGTKTLIMSSASIALVLTVYYLFAIFDDNFLVMADWTNNYDVKLLMNPRLSFPELGDDSSLTDVVRNYQSTLWWINLTAINSNSTIAAVLTYQMSIIWVVTISLSLQSAIVNNEKSISSYAFATVLSILMSLVIGYLSPSSENFYVFSFIIMLTLLLYEYSKRRLPSEKYITLTIIGSLIFLTIGDSSIILSLLMGFLALTLTSIKGGNMVRSSVHYLGSIVGSLFYYIVIIFVTDTSKIASVIIYLAVMLIVLTLFLLPMYSLGFNPSRRKDLVKFEDGIRKGIRKGVISTTLILVFISLAINFLNSASTIDLLVNYFIEFNWINNDLVMGMWLYLLILLLPSVLILIFWKEGQPGNLLGLFSVFSLLSNPIVISTLCNILSIEFTSEIVLFPSALLMLIAILNEVTKRISPLH